MGATYVEIDVRRTADGQFAVFHDDTLDCKTEASGYVSDHSMEELRALDVGFGYVIEDGSHPLRGLGRGLMPTLEEVLGRFPHNSFVINVKDDLSSAPDTRRIFRRRGNQPNRQDSGMDAIRRLAIVRFSPGAAAQPF